MTDGFPARMTEIPLFEPARKVEGDSHLDRDLWASQEKIGGLFSRLAASVWWVGWIHLHDTPHPKVSPHSFMSLSSGFPC